MAISLSPRSHLWPLFLLSKQTCVRFHRQHPKARLSLSLKTCAPFQNGPISTTSPEPLPASTVPLLCPPHKPIQYTQPQGFPAASSNAFLAHRRGNSRRSLSYICLAASLS